MGIFRNLAVGAVAAALISGGASAADRGRKTPEPPPPLPPAIQQGQSSRILGFERIVMQIPVGAEIGAVTCGGLSPKRPVYMTRTMMDFDPSTYRDVFVREAAAAGYPVDNPAASLFKETNRNGAQLVVGAAIVRQYLDVCEVHVRPGEVNLFFTNGSKGNAAFEFQVFDVLDRKVVWKGTFEGNGSAKGFADQSVPAAMHVAFQSAAQKMLRDPGFVAAATAALPTVATTAEPQDELKPPPHRIPHRPLSTVAFSQDVASARNQVVTIFAGTGMGTGFYITPELLLTNDHVVDNSKLVKIKTIGGKEYVGEVLRSNKRRDVALVRTEPLPISGVPMRLEDPAIGSQVYVIGSPADQALQGTVTSGIVSSIRVFKPSGSYFTGKFIQSDVAINHGNSGGPMFDERGNVIGISDLGLGDSGNQGLNFFIPIAEALDILNIQIDAPIAAAAANPKKVSTKP